MKTILRAILAIAALALIFSTYSFADAGADYKAKCAMCHGANGEGKAAMKTVDFASADVQKMSDAELTDTITKGKGKMMGEGDRVSETMRWNLVNLVKSHSKKDAGD